MYMQPAQLICSLHGYAGFVEISQNRASMRTSCFSRDTWEENERCAQPFLFSRCSCDNREADNGRIRSCPLFSPVVHFTLGKRNRDAFVGAASFSGVHVTVEKARKQLFSPLQGTLCLSSWVRTQSSMCIECLFSQVNGISNETVQKGLYKAVPRKRRSAVKTEERKQWYR